MFLQWILYGRWSLWIKILLKRARRGGYEWVDNYFWKYVVSELFLTLLENPKFDHRYRLLPSLAERPPYYVFLQWRAEECKRRVKRQRELLHINPNLIFNEDFYQMSSNDHMMVEYDIEEVKNYPYDVSSSDEVDG